MINEEMLSVLVCPLCKKLLYFSQDKKELVCEFDRLAFPIDNDIPIMLEDEARRLKTDEL